MKFWPFNAKARLKGGNSYPWNRLWSVGLIFGFASLLGAFILVAQNNADELLSDAKADVGDKLGYYGAILGSAMGALFAIGSAVLIEEVRRGTEAKRALKLINDALSELRASVAPMAQQAPNIPMDDEAALEPFRMSAMDVLLSVNDAIELLDLAISSAKLSEFRHMRALYRARQALQKALPTIERESRIVDERATHRILEIFYGKMQSVAEELETALAATMRDLRY